MRIAVTYDNGEVFQHFGHTQEFKVYDVDNKDIISSRIVNSNGSGHGALAELLKVEGVDILICGGIGNGANDALMDNGIEVCAGQSGNTDEAVKAFLRGELQNSGVNCDHHEEGHSCDDHEEGGCGHCGSHDEEGEEECGSCGSGCGGCGGCHMEPIMEGKNVGKTCKVHYRGTFDDGTQFDSSYDRGQTLDFVCGVGMMIRGFDAAVANMEQGEKLTIHLEPADAYGEKDPDAIITLKISELPGSEELKVGERVYLQDMYGRPVPVLVLEKDDEKIVFDANHEMAGKALNFDIELVEIVEA